MRAFEEIAGTAYGVVYDLPRSARPTPIPGSIYLRGTPGWRRYLDARERADVGEPAILFSMRALDDAERQLVVEWGTTYPNSFFLIEPKDTACDLTDPASRQARELDAALAATAGTAAGGRLGGTPLGLFLRALLGRWVYWSGPEPYQEIHHVTLDLSRADATVWSRILPELDARFPQPAFDRALAYVNDWEQELLGGPVPRARSVFRTRLGMPILRDPRCVDRALRQLVNQGRIRVVGSTLPGRPVFDGRQPVPDEISDEEFSTFVML